MLYGFAKYALWEVQGGETLLLIITRLKGSAGLIEIDAKVREVYGVILAVVLTVWLEILLFRQVRIWRITVAESMDNVGTGKSCRIKGEWYKGA